MLSPQQTKVSICVASRGDTTQLNRLLSAIRAVRINCKWELIVAINATQTNNLTAIKNSNLPIVFTHEPRPGKGRALNKAMDLAKGEWIVFTDDDVTPDVNWIVELLRAAEKNPWAQILGGRVIAKGSVPKWIQRSSNLQTALLSQHDLGDLETYYPPRVYPVGPNLAVRLSAIKSNQARWRTDLGPGTTIPMGDENAFLTQISKAASSDRLYVPSAIVQHQVNSGYFTLLSAIKRCYLCGLSAGRLSTVLYVPRRNGSKQAIKRLLEVKSFREFICVVARAIGVAHGRSAPLTIIPKH